MSSLTCGIYKSQIYRKQRVGWWLPRAGVWANEEMLKCTKLKFCGLSESRDLKAA